MPSTSPTRPRRTSTPSASTAQLSATAPPTEQHSFRRWAWTVADDVISLRNEFDSFRSRFGDHGEDTSRGSPGAISSSRPGVQPSNISLALSAPSPLHSDGGDMVAGRMLRAAADEVLAEVRDEHRTLRCSLEAEQALLRQELETLRGQLRWYLHDPDSCASRDETVVIHNDVPMLGKGRLDTMEEAILNLGREILNHAELHGVLEGAHRELQQRVEELREASNAIENLNCERFANLEQAQLQAESVLLQLQAASESQTFGARDLSQDVTRVVETVEFRLQALGEDVAIQRRRTDDLLLAFSHAQSANGRLDAISPCNEDSIADSVRIALQANPRRQPSEATRMCRTFRAWLELVPAVANRTKHAASSSSGSGIAGQTNVIGSSSASLEQELQLRLARTEQEVLAEARAQVLHHREELCHAVRLELESEPNAMRRATDERHEPGSKAGIAGSPRSSNGQSRQLSQGVDQFARLGSEVLELRRVGESQQAELSALNEEVRLHQKRLVQRIEEQSEREHQVSEAESVIEARLEASIAATEQKHSLVEDHVGNALHAVDSRVDSLEARIVADIEATKLELKVIETRLEAGIEKSSLQLGTVQNSLEEVREQTFSSEATLQNPTRVAKNLDGILASCALDIPRGGEHAWVEKINMALNGQEVVTARLHQEVVAMSEAMSAQQEALKVARETKALSVEEGGSKKLGQSPEPAIEGAISPFSEAMEVQRETASSAVGEELRQMAALASKHTNALTYSRVTEELRQCSDEHGENVADVHGVVEQPRIGNYNADPDGNSPDSARLGAIVPGTPTRFPWGIGGSILPAGSQRQKASPRSYGDDAQLQRTLESLTNRVEEALELRSEQSSLRGALDTLAAEVDCCCEEQRRDMSVCDELKASLSEERRRHRQVESLSARVEEVMDLQRRQNQNVAKVESLSASVEDVLDLQQKQNRCASQVDSLCARVEEVFEMQHKQIRCVTQPDIVPIRSPTSGQSKFQGAIDNLSTEVEHSRDEQRREMSSVQDELKLALFEGRQARSLAVKLSAEFEQACADLGDQWMENEAAVAEVNRELAVQNAKMEQVTADTQCCQASEDTLREEIYQVTKGLVELEDTIKTTVSHNGSERASTEVEIVRLSQGVQEVKLDNAKMVNELASLAERVHEATQSLRGLHGQGESDRGALKDTPMAISELRTELTGTWEEMEEWVSKELLVLDTERKRGNSELQEELCRVAAEVQRKEAADDELQEAVSKTNNELIRTDAEIQEHHALLLTIQSDLKQMAIESHSRHNEETQLRNDLVSLSMELHEKQNTAVSAMSALKDVSALPASASRQVVDTSGLSSLETRVREISAEVQKLKRSSANYSPGPQDTYWERDRDCWEELRMLTSEVGEQREATGALSSALRAVELRLSDTEKERSKQSIGSNSKQSHGASANSPALFGAMEEWKAGVAELKNALCSTWEAEDAQTLVQTLVHENGPMAISPSMRATDEALLSRISELDLQGQRTAVTLEHMRASQHTYLQEATSLREALAGTIKESEMAAQMVAREAETNANARLSKALLETRGHFNSELSAHAVGMRTYVAERVATISTDWGSHREAQQALSTKLGADIDTLQRHLAEVVDDSLDMRKQVLTLCDARCQSAHGNSGLHIHDLSQRLNALSDDVSALSHTLASPQSQQIAAIRTEVGASVVALQGEVRRLSSQLVAGEQNAQRGLSLLQRAVESLQDELHQLKQRPSQQG